MSLDRSTIEELAPDQSSLGAAKKLLAPKKWPTTACSEDGSLIWGECQGSGSTPYRVVYAPSDRGYKCSCPSRKFPCKHVLALMWLHVDGTAPFATGEPPEWIAEWLSRRRKSGGGQPAGTEKAPSKGKPKGQRSLAAAELSAAEPTARTADPKKAAAARERNRKKREAQVLAGLDELDAWLEDQLTRGLASFPAVAGEQSRVIARRLADAKAPALSSQVEQVTARMFSLPEAERGAFLAERFGGLHLLAEAYRRQEQLPTELRADVRALIGWNTERQAVLEDPDGKRVTGSWLVAARADEVQPDKLRRIETWLLREAEDSCDVALLLDFVPVRSGGGADATYSVGERLSATLAYYPSSVPMRAAIESMPEQPGSGQPAGGSNATQAIESWPKQSFAKALQRVDAMRAKHPWLDRWPLAADDLRISLSSSGALWLCDADGKRGLPLDPSQDDVAYPLVGVRPFRGFAICDSRGATLHYANTDIGSWRST
ncbi:MAG: SWIM zinc finger family protein [Planctomycetota bacterium]